MTLKQGKESGRKRRSLERATGSGASAPSEASHSPSVPGIPHRCKTVASRRGVTGPGLRVKTKRSRPLGGKGPSASENRCKTLRPALAGFSVVAVLCWGGGAPRWAWDCGRVVSAEGATVAGSARRGSGRGLTRQNVKSVGSRNPKCKKRRFQGLGF